MLLSFFISVSSPSEMAEAAADPVLLTFTNCESWMLYIETKLRGEVDLNEYCSPSLWDYLRGSLDRDSFFPGTDEKVLKEIRMSCSQEMLPHILYAEYAAEAWKWLADHAVAASTEEKGQIRRDLTNILLNFLKFSHFPAIGFVSRKGSVDCQKKNTVKCSRNTSYSYL